VVGEAQLSLAIGRRGQNVRLASQLTGWSIDILTEAEESERRQKEFASRTEIFVQALEVDEMFAQLLASEGFESVEEIAYVDAMDLASIEGLNDEIAEELQARARDFLDKQAAELEAKRVALGVADDLKNVPGLTGPMLVAMGEKGVKTLEDFAGFTGDDLRGWFETKNGERVREPGVLEKFELTQEQADALILNARIAAGWIEAPPEPEPEPEQGGADELSDVFPDRS
jgi:transcription termination/antitermination protein NusA